MAGERPKDFNFYVMIPRFNYRDLHTFRGDITCGEVRTVELLEVYFILR